MSGNGKAPQTPDDPFADLEKLRLPYTPPTASAPTGQSPKPKRDRVRGRAGFAGFTLVPDLWKERLKGTTGAAHDLAIELLHERWRSDKETFVASNALAGRAGVSRKSKRLALLELEHRGLVKVERQSPKAPLVTVLHWRAL